MRGFEGGRFRLFGRNLECLGVFLFASVLCNLNCNILWQANQKISFLPNFAPSVITAVFFWNSVFFSTEFGKIINAEILFALWRHKGITDTFCQKQKVALAGQSFHQLALFSSRLHTG